jgi:hypothetical protein
VRPISTALRIFLRTRRGATSQGPSRNLRSRAGSRNGLPVGVAASVILVVGVGAVLSQQPSKPPGPALISDPTVITDLAWNRTDLDTFQQQTAKVEQAGGEEEMIVGG